MIFWIENTSSDRCKYTAFRSSNIIWVDLEMTGLDQEKDHIMEMACIVTDKHLNILAEGPNLVIHQVGEVEDSLLPNNLQIMSTVVFYWISCFWAVGVGWGTVIVMYHLGEIFRFDSTMWINLIFILFLFQTLWDRSKLGIDIFVCPNDLICLKSSLIIG